MPNQDSAAGSTSRVILTGNPTVLVVDDEELMREVATIMIEESGGKVIPAVDGQDAVSVFEKNKDVIDFVFMDFSMPNLNGYEAYLEITKIRSDVGFVFVSGLKITKELEALRAAGRIEFLSKPFHESTLLAALDRLAKRRAARRGP